MNGLAEHSSVCFIGNPFSVYFSTRCTTFTAAGASESRPCASMRIKPEIDGLRLVGGNPDSPTCPGTPTTTHASTTGSKLAYTLAGDSSRSSLKPELTMADPGQSIPAGHMISYSTKHE